MTNDGTLDTTAITDGANFVLRPVSRRLLIGGGAALGVGLTALGSPTAEAAPGRLSASWNGKSSRAAIRFLKGVTNAYHTIGPATGAELPGRLRADRRRLRLRQRPGHHRAAERGRGGGGPGVGRRSALRPDARRDLHRRPAAAGVPRGHLHPRRTATPTSRTSSGWSAPRSATWPGRASPWPSWPGPPGSLATRPVRCAIADWIQANTYSTSGLGGYTFGDRRRPEGLTSRPSTTSTWPPSSG